MKKSLEHLDRYEQKAIDAYQTHLNTHLAQRLLAMHLFGSKARGDFHAESDIDLLIIVDGLTSPIRWEIDGIAADYSLQYNVLINPHVYDKTRWHEIKQHHDTLWREIEQDGIPLS